VLRLLAEVRAAFAPAREHLLLVCGDRLVDIGVAEDLPGEVSAVDHGEVDALTGERRHEMRGVAQQRYSRYAVPGADASVERARPAGRPDRGTRGERTVASLIIPRT
jgi:hypothetical protein